MSFAESLTKHLPEVVKPTQKRLEFKEKLKWTAIVLLLFFILGNINLFGVSENALSQFANIAILLGAKFGTIISLGIGPIVTASIIMQILNGSGILSFDIGTEAGKRKFQANQKLLAYALLLIESTVFVFMGGLAPDIALAGTSSYTILQLIIVSQLILGGFLIMLMDDVIAKWGFGSGISLFIVAGVSQELFVQLFSWVKPGDEYSVGVFLQLFQSIQNQDITTLALSVSSIFFTILVFGVAIYAQSMKVEVPLSMGRIRGHGIRWPLNFLYTSNIPVILIAALLANVQLIAQFATRFSSRIDPLAIQAWVTGPSLIPTIIQSGTFNIGVVPYLQAISYLVIFVAGAIMFSWFWVQTSGMDARSQAKRIMQSGLQIPGFRKDARIMERILERYIGPLTIMGAIAVAFIAVFADISGARGSGIGILLAVMIIYKMYEDIAKQHLGDMNPGLRQFVGG